jgi:hypothetical protein
VDEILVHISDGGQLSVISFIVKTFYLFLYTFICSCFAHARSAALLRGVAVLFAKPPKTPGQKFLSSKNGSERLVYRAIGRG